jgi:hypothetical protein
MCISLLRKINNKLLISYKLNYLFYNLFLISIKFVKIKYNKDKFLKFLRKKNKFSNHYHISICKFKLFNKIINLNFYKRSEFYYKNTFSLLIFFCLNINSQLKKISKIIS